MQRLRPGLLLPERPERQQKLPRTTPRTFIALASGPAALPKLSTDAAYSNSSPASQCGELRGNWCVFAVCRGTFAAKGAVDACTACPLNSSTFEYQHEGGHRTVAHGRSAIAGWDTRGIVRYASAWCTVAKLALSGVCSGVELVQRHLGACLGGHSVALESHGLCSRSVS